MSLYGDYIKELRGQRIVETPSGFATYIFYPEAKECYMVDVYVTPERRGEGLARNLVETIEKIAKGVGMNRLTTTVIPQHNNSTASLKVWLSCGFKLHRTDLEKIVLLKEIQ